MPKSSSIQTFFPRYCVQYAVLAYSIGLLSVVFFFPVYRMQWYWWLFGVIEVLGFFVFSNSLSKRWLHTNHNDFKKQLFAVALFLRVTVVLFLYWFFTEMNGEPFMFAAADAKGYHGEAEWIAELLRSGDFSSYWNYKFGGGGGYSDAGYPMYLGFVYYLTMDSIIVARLLKAIWSSLACVLVYKLASRNFSESTGRMAGIFAMLMPNLIYYCGVHLKETEMCFMMILFLERADNLLRSKQFNFSGIFPVLLLAVSLFFFRTVMGLTALFSAGAALLLSRQRVISLSRRWLILIMLLLAGGYFVGGRVSTEIEYYWQNKDTGQALRTADRARKGNSLATYGTAAVFAPMIFTIPFPTMVETQNQETMRLLHGGLVVKNIMSFFVIFSIFMLIVSGNWRDNVLIGAFMIAYLAILTVSAFAHAERFHIPDMWLEMLFAAHGVSLMTKKKHRTWFLNWCLLCVLIMIGWNWFKLAGRGLV